MFDLVFEIGVLLINFDILLLEFLVLVRNLYFLLAYHLHGILDGRQVEREALSQPGLLDIFTIDDIGMILLELLELGNEHFVFILNLGND